MEGLIDAADKATEQDVTLIYLDLNKFKYVNDTYGHEAGDKVLKIYSKSLRKIFGKIGFVGRMGGDEFIIITPMLDSDSIEALMQKLTDVANANNDSGEYPYELSFSYGYAQFTVGKEKDSDGFMKRMDDNMYEYKVAKKARWAAEGKKTKIGDALSELGYIDEVEYAKVIAEQQRLPFVDIDKYDISLAAANKIPVAVAKKYTILAINETNDRLTIATKDYPIDQQTGRIVGEIGMVNDSAIASEINCST